MTAPRLFDAYLHRPTLSVDEALQMHSFGVRGALVFGTGESRNEPVLASLRSAGIQAFAVDGVSPDDEPERMWEERWRDIVVDVEEGRTHALGELVLVEGSARALRIIDRHCALALRCGVPLLVAYDARLDPRWQDALRARAAKLGDLWWWTRVPLDDLEGRLTEGAGVLLGPRASDGGAMGIAQALSTLDDAQVQRVAIGSARGRGLNPFALAACEIAWDALGLDAQRAVLEGGRLASRLGFVGG